MQVCYFRITLTRHVFSSNPIVVVHCIFQYCVSFYVHIYCRLEVKIDIFKRETKAKTIWKS